jgi:regulator of protease activity HflC (stomatin/prohibitin superfamily)
MPVVGFICYGLIFLGIILIVLVVKAIHILTEYERGVIFRLGRYVGIKGPGFVIIIPFIDKLKRVSLRTIVHDVPPQDVITKDNVSIKVNAVVYFRVLNPEKAIIEVQDYRYATSQVAQTTLRSVSGESELDDVLAHREKINTQLQELIDHATDPWGIKVSMVEIKHVDLPSDMQRAMARQAEAERDKRAKIIHAEGEFLAAQKLSQAADVISQNPVSLQLRYLQTLSEIAVERNSTILFPIPIELLKSFEKFQRG